MARFSTLLAVMCVAVVAAPAAAHVCMWDPPQRGGYDIAGPAENPCYRKVGPCGTDAAGPTTELPAGKPYTVHFQQNANHYFTGKPGSLVVDWAEGFGPSFGTFTTLLSIPDYNAMGELTQTNFTKQIMVPDAPCDKCVLRVRYISNNPDESPEGHGPTFYQCANVAFTKSAAAMAKAEEPIVEAAEPEPLEGATDDDSYHAKCCAPATFSIKFFMNKEMGPSKGTIYYDNNTHFMREDVVHGDGSGVTPADGTFQIYSNFSSGNGYWYNVNTGKCMLGGPFGLDLWNEWCFGSFEESEKFARTGICPAPASGFCNFYQNGDFTFTATQDMCLPSSIMGHDGNQASVAYYGADVGPIPASTFVPPAACKAALLEAAATGRRATATDDQFPESATRLLLAARS